MSDSDPILRGNVQQMFGDYCATLDDFNALLDRVPASPLHVAAMKVARAAERAVPAWAAP